jgi:hypothetical protein
MIQAPKTFAQMGTQEFGQRGFQGALFSPTSKFAMNPALGGDPRFKGPAGQPGIIRALMASMGGIQRPSATNTLTGTAPVGGGGLPVDGGLSGEGEGLEEILQQMLGQ